MVLSFKTFNSVIRVLLVLGLLSILCDVWGASLRAECWLELLLSLKSILLRRHFCFLLSNAARTSLFLTTWRTKIKNPYNDKNEESLLKHNTDGTRSINYLISKPRWRACFVEKLKYAHYCTMEHLSRKHNICLFVCLFVCLSVWLFVCLFVCLQRAKRALNFWRERRINMQWNQS